MSTDWNQDSLEFILDHIREAPEKQIRAMDTLDAKMIQVFISASIVIGLAGLSSASGAARWEVIPLALALLAYVSVAVVAIIHLWPREIRWNLHADTLWPEYGKYNLADIKEVLAQDTSDAYAFNRRVLDAKANTILKALIGTGLEVTFVGIAIAIPLLKAWST